MKAYLCREFGPISSHKIEDIDIPKARWAEEDSPCTPDEYTIFRGKLVEIM